MEKRDYIMSQIEEMGKVIAALLSGFRIQKSKGQIVTTTEATNQQFKEKLNIDINYILSASKSDLIQYFEKRKLLQFHLGKFATYFYEIGALKQRVDGIDSETYLSKAKELIDLSASITKTVTFEMLNLEKKIEELVKEIQHN